MKVGTVGAIIVLAGGAALLGAVFAKDKGQLSRARTSYEDGKKLLAAGKPEEALEPFTKSLDAALLVNGGITGSRAQALEVAGDARKAIRTCEALVALQAGDATALAAIDDALAEAGPRALPREPLEKAEAKRLAQLSMTAAETLEKLALDVEHAAETPSESKAEYHELAEQAFKVAGRVAREGEHEWANVAAQGEKRAAARGLVAHALAANAADDGARAREYADKAAKALEADPFQGGAEALELRKAVRSISAEGNDRAKVNAFEQEVARLAGRVGTNELGAMLADVEALKVPELEGGHRAASELDGKRIVAAERLAKVKQAATDFKDMVLATESGEVKVYVDRHEVTNEAWKKFQDEKKPYTEGRNAAVWGTEEAAQAAGAFFDATFKTAGPATWGGGNCVSGKERHPVAGVSALEAQAFARASGKRLPTYTEWLGAAGTPATPYPWGAEWREDRGNVRGKDGKDTMPVGSFAAGAARTGAVDLIGNVREIVTEKGGFRAVGGSYLSKPDAATLDTGVPLLETARPKDQGFRCARELRWKGD